MGKICKKYEAHELVPEECNGYWTTVNQGVKKIFGKLARVHAIHYCKICKSMKVEVFLAISKKALDVMKGDYFPNYLHPRSHEEPEKTLGDVKVTK